MMHARLTDRDDDAPTDIDGLTLEWREDPAVPEWELVARLGGRLGECLAWGLSRHLADHPEYRRWVIVEWIEVAESHRRRGIGGRLVREQMRAHASRGGTDALLQVFLPDPNAARFHEAMGFSVIETGTTYRKDGPPADRLQRIRASSGTAGTRSSSTPPIANSTTRLSTPVLVSPVSCANTPTSSGPRIAANFPKML